MTQDFFINESIFLEDVYMRKNLILTGSLSASNLPDYSNLFKNLTANWQNTYITVSALSASWGIDRDFDLQLRALSANWQNTYITVRALSASWGIDRDFDLQLRTLSGNWQNTYITVSALSASWGIDRDFDLQLRALSANWQNTYITVSALSASWGGGTNYDLQLRALSGNWQNTYVTVSALSASWGVDRDYDLQLRALSGNWQNTYTTVSSNSGLWDQAYNNSVYITISSVNDNFVPLNSHSGLIFHVDTNTKPITAFINEPLSSGFNIGIVVRGTNSVFVRSNNSTIISNGSELSFNLDKAFVYKEGANSFIAIGDLI